MWDLPGVDQVDELLAEGVAVVYKAQPWRLALNNLEQLLEHRVPLGVGEASSRYLHQCDT